MLTDQEADQLIELIIGTSEVMGHEVRPAAVMLMVEDLCQYPLLTLKKALADCRKELTGKLSTKHIIDRLQDGGVWLTANEAWAIALPAADESQSVAWTDEIAKAWAIALPILQNGDKVGARMAFIPAYERLVKQARDAGKAVQWQVSQGWDPQLRIAAMEKAVTAGLLPPPKPEPRLALPSPAEEANRERMAGMLSKWANDMRTSGEQYRKQAEQERQQRRTAYLEEFEKKKADTVEMALSLDEKAKLRRGEV